MNRIFKIITIPFVLFFFNYLFANWVNPYITHIVCLMGINILLAVSLNLINGQTGQFSLGHAGFMAIGAYAAAGLTVYGPEMASWAEEVFFVISILAGGLLAGLAGILVGFPTLRLRGDYLAITTLGFGEIVRVIVLNMDVLGGARGFGGITEHANFFWIYLFCTVSVVLIRNLVYSVKGRAFVAIREDEIAAESVGIDTARYKMMAFAVGAFFAGIGGGLFAHVKTYLHTDMFTFLKSIEFVVMVVLGGLGSLTGSIIAAVILTILPEALRSASEWRMVFYALGLIIMMLIRPQGILGNREWKWMKGGR